MKQPTRLFRRGPSLTSHLAATTTPTTSMPKATREVELIQRTYRQDWPCQPQRRSLGLLVRLPGAKWHVNVTFSDAPRAPAAVPLWRQKKDLEGLCHCIDFDPIPLRRDTVTELVLFTKHNATEASRLPVKAEPDVDSLYAGVAGRLYFYTQEDPLRVRFPLLNVSSRTSTKDMSEITKERELADGVHIIRLCGDERRTSIKR